MHKLISLAVVVLLCGCSWFTNGGDLSEARINFAIQVGVGSFIMESPDKCPRAIEVTNNITATLYQNPETTVAAAVDMLKLQIDWSKLSNEQTIIVLGAIGFVESELVNRIDSGQIDASRLITVHRFSYMINRQVISVCSTLKP